MTSSRIYGLQVSQGPRTVSLTYYRDEADVDHAYAAWDAYIQANLGLNFGIEKLMREMPGQGPWKIVQYMRTNWPTEPPATAKVALPGGLDARELADAVLEEYGSYSISEYGERALPDWLFSVSDGYAALNDAERKVIDAAVGAELYGW